jgi:Bacterial Ig domain
MVLSTVKVLPRRLAVVGAVLLLGLAWVLGAGHLTRASAATIDNAITSVSIKQASAGPNTPMELDLTWAVPDSASAGDTFTLDLPGELKSNTSAFDLLAPDGSVVAKAVVVNGVVTFTLTDYVDSHNDVHGTAFFSVRFDNATTPTSGPVSLTFTAGSKVFHDTVNKTGVGPINRAGPRKVGFWTHLGTVTGADALTWTVDSPTGPFDKVTFHDTVGAGQSIDCGSLTYVAGSGLDANGRPTKFTALGAKRVLGSTCAAGSLTVTLGPATADEVLRIRYLTNVTDSSLASYSNSADVTVDGTKVGSVSTKVRVQGAGGNGSGTSSPTTSPSTSPSTSPTSTSTTTTSTTTTGTPTVSGTSTSTTSTTGQATVLPTKLTNTTSGGSVSGVSGLAFTGANVAPMLGLAGALLGGGLLLTMFGRRPGKSRRH